jgi:hypothetical protein
MLAQSLAGLRYQPKSTISIESEYKQYTGIGKMISVVDPYPNGSKIFGRIMIRNSNSRLWIRKRNLTWTLPTSFKKISNMIIMTSKIHISNSFSEKHALKCHDKIVKIVGSEKEWMFRVGSENRFETFCYSGRIRIQNLREIPVCDPDPKKIVPHYRTG